jgi:hypothetical protein
VFDPGRSDIRDGRQRQCAIESVRLSTGHQLADSAERDNQENKSWIISSVIAMAKTPSLNASMRVLLEARPLGRSSGAVYEDSRVLPQARIFAFMV